LAEQLFCLILLFVRTKITTIIRAGHEISPTLGELEETRKIAWEEVKAKDYNMDSILFYTTPIT